MAKKYVVLEYFEDNQDNKKPYNEGDTYPKPANKKVSKERLKELSSKKNVRGRPVIKEVEETE